MGTVTGQLLALLVLNMFMQTDAGLQIWIGADDGSGIDAAATCDPVTQYIRAVYDNWITLPVSSSGLFQLVGPSHTRFLTMLLKE